MDIVFQPNPNFSPQEASRIAEELYDLIATAKALPSERDQNFLLENQSGERFVLKFANPGEAEELLDFQNKAVEHIAAQGGLKIVPRVLPARNGDVITQIEEEGKKFFVRLLTYLPGRVLAEINPRTPELLLAYQSYC